MTNVLRMLALLAGLVTSTAYAVTCPTFAAGDRDYISKLNTLSAGCAPSGAFSSPLTTKGDIWGYSTLNARVPIGTNGQVLTADSTQTLGLKWATPFLNPMTTGGDLIYGGASGVATRLANGSNGQVLTSSGGTSAPTWTTLSTGGSLTATYVGYGDGSNLLTGTSDFAYSTANGEMTVTKSRTGTMRQNFQNTSSNSAAESAVGLLNNNSEYLIAGKYSTGYSTSGLKGASIGYLANNAAAFLFANIDAADFIFARGGTGATNEVARLGAGSLSLGKAGTTVGSIVFNNATSGTITISPVTGALGTTAVTVPATAGTLVVNPMTTAGDTIYGGTSGVPTRLAGGTSGYVLTSNGATSAPSWQAASGGSAGLQCIRLYSTTGVPVPTTDTATVSTIYVGAFECNTATVLDGSDNLVSLTVTEHSLALSGLTNGKIYDVWLYSNSGTPTVELSAAWTNDTTRSDAIALVKGIYVKSSDHTRLHIGTIYSTGTNSTRDSETARFVWNRYNQRRASMRAWDSTDTWNYTTATMRQANGNTANQLNFVVGDASAVVEAFTIALVYNSTAGVGVISAIGLDSTTTTAADSQIAYGNIPGVNLIVGLRATYQGRPGLGRHSLMWLEWSAATGTSTWQGDGGGTVPYSGINGSLMN